MDVCPHLVIDLYIYNDKKELNGIDLEQEAVDGSVIFLRFTAVPEE